MGMPLVSRVRTMEEGILLSSARMVEVVEAGMEGEGGGVAVVVVLDADGFGMGGDLGGSTRAKEGGRWMPLVGVVVVSAGGGGGGGEGRYSGNGDVVVSVVGAVPGRPSPRSFFSAAAAAAAGVVQDTTGGVGGNTLACGGGERGSWIAEGTVVAMVVVVVMVVVWTGKVERIGGGAEVVVVVTVLGAGGRWWSSLSGQGLARFREAREDDGGRDNRAGLGFLTEEGGTGEVGGESGLVGAVVVAPSRVPSRTIPLAEGGWCCGGEGSRDRSGPDDIQDERNG